MFPSPIAPQTYITQSLCSPVPMFPIFPSSFVSQSLCSPLLFHRSVFHSLYSPNMSPSPYVPQYLCSTNMLPSPSPYVPPTSSPVPMFPGPIPQKGFLSLCSPNMFPITYVPQCLCSPVPMFRLQLVLNIFNLGWYPFGESCSYIFYKNSD